MEVGKVHTWTFEVSVRGCCHNQWLNVPDGFIFFVFVSGEWRPV